MTGTRLRKLRLRRKALIVLAFLSVAVILPWLRSYWWTDRICGDRVDSQGRLVGYWSIATWHGRFVVDYESSSLPLPTQLFGEAEQVEYIRHQTWKGEDLPVRRLIPPESYVGHFGFGWYRSDGPNVWIGLQTFPRNYGRTRSTVATAPLAMFVGLIIGLSAWTLIASARRGNAQRSRGLCLVCGYDLRASANRCPECGTPISARPDSPPLGT
jgi:hypothetical protein